MKKSKQVGEYLDLLFPNPRCELNYQKDYELLLSIVLSAQTTDKRVNMVTPILFQKYSSLIELKNASISDLESIIKPIGSFRKKSIYIKEISKIIDEEYHGVVPRDREQLIKLPGVGRKTANVFLSEYYHDPMFGVDTHVERIAKRLQISEDNSNVLDVENDLMRFFPKEEWARRHLQLVLFGRYYCKAMKPSCDSCELKNICKKNISFH